jgi:hypothetical protein
MRVHLPLTLLLVACGAGGGDDDDTPSERTTWYQDVAPIVAEHCMGCHRDGGIAPFSLTEYQDAADVATMMLFEVEQGNMPPWDAVDGDDCTPRFAWKNDPRLSAEEIEVLRAWVDDGRLAGEIADVPDPPDTTLEGVTHSVTPSTGYATSGDSDEFICYLLDPGVESLGYMTGMQLTPGNPAVVHHAVTAVMPPGAELDALVAQYGYGEPFDCAAGQSNPAGSYLLNVWTPGQEPMTTPPELGIPIAAGSALITQFHYHPVDPVNAPDASTIELRLSSTPPDMLYTIIAWGNAFQSPELLPGPNDPGGTPTFYIPADEPEHSESMRFQVITEATDRFPLFAAYPHMHYIGVGLEVRIERATPAIGEPAEECLINVDRWDFDWQRTYQYDGDLSQVPTVGDDDVVEIRCTYDNTMENPFVQRALDERGLTSPIDVYLGEESLDEMCLGMFMIAFPAPAGAAPGPQLSFRPL